MHTLARTAALVLIAAACQAQSLATIEQAVDAQVGIWGLGGEKRV